MDLLIKGNLKMGKNVYLYNLPPKATCTPTVWCLKGRNGKPACYALRNNFNFPSVKIAARKRLRASKLKSFVPKMVEEINKKAVKYFRFHSSGDCYSEEYITKLMAIAFNCPATLFRTTTRRRDLARSLRQLNSLSNFIVRESLDVERPKPKMRLPIAALSSLPVAKKVFKCINNCENCNYSCWHNDSDMCFEEH